MSKTVQLYYRHPHDSREWLIPVKPELTEDDIAAFLDYLPCLGFHVLPPGKRVLIGAILPKDQFLAELSKVISAMHAYDRGEPQPDGPYPPEEETAALRAEVDNLRVALGNMLQLIGEHLPPKIKRQNADNINYAKKLIHGE